MQNAMLDSIVSSNSQELPNASSALKLFENPQFKVRVIMRCSDPWFVAKDACDCLEITNVSKACQTLDEDEKGITKVYTLGGSQDMMLISESGLYTLIMRSNKPEAKVFRKWVTSEVLPSIRKTGGYSVVQPTIFDYARALIAEKERSDALEAQNKALTADLASEKEAHEKDNEDFKTGFDIINAQKAQIGSNREATAMATASAKSRECKRLTAENAKLKDAVGRGKDWHTVNMMTAEWKREFGHAPSYHQLQKFSADLPKDMKPVRDVEVKVVLRNGSEKVNKVFRYHREAWEKYREYEENLSVSAESRRDASNEGIGLNDTDTEVEYF